MDLKGTRPQMSEQLELPLEGKGETPRVQQNEEVPMATRVTERSGNCDLMEMAVRRPNLQAALKRCVFLRYPTSDSERIRPLIPTESDH